MYWHGPSCLEGPVGRTSGSWGSGAVDSVPTICILDCLDMEEAKQTEETPSSAVPVRWDLVERVRREVAAGTYETPEKWEAALDEMARRLNLS